MKYQSIVVFLSFMLVISRESEEKNIRQLYEI